jgi:hypothetical protein
LTVSEGGAKEFLNKLGEGPEKVAGKALDGNDERKY